MTYPYSKSFIRWYIFDTAPLYSSHKDEDFIMYCMGEEL